jgi:hypothetical protein
MSITLRAETIVYLVNYFEDLKLIYGKFINKLVFGIEWISRKRIKNNSIGRLITKSYMRDIGVAYGVRR